MARRWQSGSQRNLIASIKRAEEQGYIERSPLTHMKKPRCGRKEQVVTPAEYEALLVRSKIAAALCAGLRPGWVAADAAYDSDAIRAWVRQARARACIRPNPTRKRRKRHDRERYKHRNAIGRFLGAINRFRRVATRYEKKADHNLGFVWIAAVLLGLT